MTNPNHDNVVDLVDDPASPQRKKIRTDVDGTILLLSDSESDDEFDSQRQKRPVIAGEIDAYDDRRQKRRKHSHTTSPSSALAIDLEPDSKAEEDKEVVLVQGSERSFRPASTIEATKGQANDDDDSCFLVGSTGTNALEDFPHPRENCVVAPMANTWHGLANRKYCINCYCYVCDTPVMECQKWMEHCNARHKNVKWQKERERFRKKKQAKAVGLPATAPLRHPGAPRASQYPPTNYKKPNSSSSGARSHQRGGGGSYRQPSYSYKHVVGMPPYYNPCQHQPYYYSHAASQQPCQCHCRNSPYQNQSSYYSQASPQQPYHYYQAPYPHQPYYYGQAPYQQQSTKQPRYYHSNRKR